MTTRYAACSCGSFTLRSKANRRVSPSVTVPAPYRCRIRQPGALPARAGHLHRQGHDVESDRRKRKRRDLSLLSDMRLHAPRRQRGRATSASSAACCLIGGGLEVVEGLQGLRVDERKDLGHEHAAHVPGRIDPESKTPAVDLRIEDRKVIFLQRSASDFFNRISLAFHPLRQPLLNGPYVRCGA